MNFDNLTNYLNYLVDKRGIPGVDCIVYKNHKMLYRHLYGKVTLRLTKLNRR